MGHTPGPWKVSGQLIVSNETHPRGAGKVRVARVEFVELVPQGERAANARLVAAAPELLSAARAISDAAVGPDNEGCWRVGPFTIQALRAAIAKATGQGGIGDV